MYTYLASGSQGDIYKISNDRVAKKYTSRESEYVKNPTLTVALGEAEAWNFFYSQYNPKYATAGVSKNQLILPFINGTSIASLSSAIKNEPSFKKALIAFKEKVNKIMIDGFGHKMFDQKNEDILLLADGSFAQLDFGEFGEYKLKTAEISAENTAIDTLNKLSQLLKNKLEFKKTSFFYTYSKEYYDISKSVELIKQRGISATQKIQKINNISTEIARIISDIECNHKTTLKACAS